MNAITILAVVVGFLLVLRSFAALAVSSVVDKLRGRTSSGCQARHATVGLSSDLGRADDFGGDDDGEDGG
jgi:hypothetical protein